jgi:hypothetical protein
MVSNKMAFNLLCGEILPSSAQSGLNVNNNNIIRMNMWVLCEYNRIMLL